MTTRALLLDDEEFRFLTNLLDVLTDSSSNTRVEVRPESVDKRYAVLAFFRGDLQAIIGFRFPKDGWA